MNKLFHGVACYPELWPEADLDRDIAEMKRVGINVARIGEFAWSKMEPDEGRISLDFFVRVMDRFHEAGLEVNDLPEVGGFARFQRRGPGEPDGRRRGGRGE